MTYKCMGVIYLQDKVRHLITCIKYMVHLGHTWKKHMHLAYMYTDSFVYIVIINSTNYSNIAQPIEHQKHF